MTNLPWISGLGEPQARGCQSQKNGLVWDENSVPYRGDAPGFLAGRVYGNLRAAEARCFCHFQKSSAQVPVNDPQTGNLVRTQSREFRASVEAWPWALPIMIGSARGFIHLRKLCGTLALLEDTKFKAAVSNIQPRADRETDDDIRLFRIESVVSV